MESVEQAALRIINELEEENEILKEENRELKLKLEKECVQ